MMLNGLVAGVGDPVVLAQLAKKRLRVKTPELEQALQGSFAAHERLAIDGGHSSRSS